MLALSRDGAQVEGRTEEGESVALALDNRQARDPTRDKEDPVDQNSFRLHGLLLSAAAAESKSDTRQPSIARAPLDAEPPADDNEAAWFSRAAFGRKASYLPSRNSNPPVQDAVWRPSASVHGYLQPWRCKAFNASSKLLGFVLRHVSNPDDPTPSNTDAPFSAECCFALLAQGRKFADGLVPGDTFFQRADAVKEGRGASSVPGARA